MAACRAVKVVLLAAAARAGFPAEEAATAGAREALAAAAAGVVGSA